MNRPTQPPGTRKTVLIATFTYPPDANGVAHVAAAHAEGLSRLGYNVIVATSPAHGRKAANPGEGIQVREFNIRRSGHRPGAYTGEIAAYQSFLRETAFDVVICHAWASWPVDLAVPVLREAHCGRVLFSHGVQFNVRPSGMLSPRDWLRWLLWQTYMRDIADKLLSFDCLAVLSAVDGRPEFADTRIARKAGRRVEVVPNGVEAARFHLPQSRRERFRTRLGLAGTTRVILNISNFDRRKNQEFIQRAFWRLASSDAVLVLIGSQFNPYAKALMAAQAKRPSGTDRVKFLEQQDQESVADAYCAADVFALGSRTEAQPLVLLEAMAADLPFVSTDVGCAAEFPGGVVVRSEAQMAAELKRLLADEKLCRELGARGRQAVADRYNWPSVTGKLDQLLGSLQVTPR